ncbi:MULTISPECIES: hypothetical protein [Capnocytophaga]|nr:MULTISPECIES: hypothetical protein [Capnocytophaga]
MAKCEDLNGFNWTFMLKISTTTRNLNTLTKLVGMAEEMGN